MDAGGEGKGGRRGRGAVRLALAGGGRGVFGIRNGGFKHGHRGPARPGWLAGLLCRTALLPSRRQWRLPDGKVDGPVGYASDRPATSPGSFCASPESRRRLSVSARMMMSTAAAPEGPGLGRRGPVTAPRLLLRTSACALVLGRWPCAGLACPSLPACMTAQGVQFAPNLPPHQANSQQQKTALDGQGPAICKQHRLAGGSCCRLVGTALVHQTWACPCWGRRAKQGTLEARVPGRSLVHGHGCGCLLFLAVVFASRGRHSGVWGVGGGQGHVFFFVRQCDGDGDAARGSDGVAQHLLSRSQPQRWVGGAGGACAGRMELYHGLGRGSAASEWNGQVRRGEAVEV